MRAVLDVRDARQGRISAHPFLRWLSTADVPLDRRFDWAPMAALFVMQFRDLNRCLLRPAELRNEFEWVLNHGTLEDETHSRLFLADWRTLGLDRRLGWKASDLLWWLFLSEEQEAFRRIGMRYISIIAADGDDPFLRFAHAEASEAAGNVLFSVCAPLATQLEALSGEDYPYFGPYHLNRESGHVGNIEGVFEKLILSETQRAAGKHLCAEMFEIMENVFDQFLAYARRYVDVGDVPRRKALALVAGAPDATPATPAPTEPLPADIDARHARVWRILQARMQRAAKHPFFAWLANSGLRPDQCLASFIPLWSLDIFGYRDLAKYAFTYAEPRSAGERAINTWAEELSTHSALFLNDWNSLALDRQLGFSASDTLEFLFLDADTDLHREHLTNFAKLAFRHPDPTLRWWMMTALESTGEMFFAQTKRLSLAIESESNLRLDYLSERHHLGSQARHARPKLPPALLQPGDEDIAIGLVDTVYDALESNLTRSYCVARANRFRVSQ
jgi:hypothetical protein